MKKVIDELESKFYSDDFMGIDGKIDFNLILKWLRDKVGQEQMQVMQKFTKELDRRGLINRNCSTCNWDLANYDYKCAGCDHSDLDHYEVSTEIIAEIESKFSV